MCASWKMVQAGVEPATRIEPTDHSTNDFAVASFLSSTDKALAVC